MRVEQPVGERGSLKWVQRLVGRHAPFAEAELRPVLGLGQHVTVDWRSPCEKDDRAEYRDGAFLERIGVGHLRPALQEFWPRRGPQWDALARTSDGSVLLFEAKAHARELASSCTASPRSTSRIEAALAAAKAHYGVSPGANWLAGYYQYANRLAHLYFLRRHTVDAHLVFVYFMNDREMRGPSSREEWEASLAVLHRALGLGGAGAIPGLHNVFIDVAGLV